MLIYRFDCDPGKKPDVNILCLSGDTLDTNLGIETLEAFIATSFLEERTKLIDKLSKLFLGNI